MTLPEEYQTVMVVAHNPGLEGLLYVLAGESARMPTSALAQVELPIETWRDIDDEVEGKLGKLVRGKEGG